MQRLTRAGLIGLSLALAACGSETEEAPDITQAIPLNIDEEDEAGDQLDGGPDATPPLPGAAQAGDGGLPDTMETGSNPPGFEPPEGSKVQRIN